MRTSTDWFILIPIALFALWQLQVLDPFMSPLVSGLLLLALGLLAGLRVGIESAARFINEMLRLNKFLAEQHRDLAETNHEMLKSMLAEEDENVEIEEHEHL